MSIPIVTLVLQSKESYAQAVFEGKIINASQDSSGIAQSPVQLWAMSAQDQNPVATAQTLSSGKGLFQFRIGQTDTSAIYYASTEFQGVSYYSQRAKFVSPSGRQARTIVAYDSTHSAAAITTLMHHLFIEDVGENITVRESRVLSNPSTKAVVSVKKDSLSGTYNFRYDLPFTARNFAPSATGTHNTLQLVGNEVHDSGIALPGNRQVSYTYEIPWQRDVATVLLDMSFLTRSLQLFIGNPQIKLASEQLQDLGPFVIRGTSYQRYGANELAPGTRVQFTLRRGSQAREPSILILPITAIILLGGLLFSLAQKPKAAQVQLPKDQAKLLARRKELIHAIAKIDAKPETKGHAQLQRQRQNLFHDLQRIELGLHESKSAAKSKRR